MSPHSATAHGRRRLVVPVRAVYEESVLHPTDPPIYRELLQLWASRGRTLPGRRDPEWIGLAAPLVPSARVSASQARRGGGR
ncbi:hypothetical protein OGH68_05845 [Streptomyces peucetius]|uniref:Uncharacterized protein n=1 Tax=Streptomyces peucetius TaxID=1950 RepID=A0ABY6I223_STRPE|nr:hypothetical protein OGH68_05845 [Streptomyces peucetius]